MSEETHRSVPRLRFQVAERSYLVPLGAVAEVTPSAEHCLVPRIPLDLGGVVNVRGEPVPVLDGGTVLQGRPCPPYRYAILLNIDEHRLGVLVTGVSRIERRRPTSTEETAPASDDPPFVRRALLPDGPVGVVDETGLRARVRELLAGRPRQREE